MATLPTDPTDCIATGTFSGQARHLTPSCNEEGYIMDKREEGRKVQGNRLWVIAYTVDIITVKNVGRGTVVIMLILI